MPFFKGSVDTGSISFLSCVSMQIVWLFSKADYETDLLTLPSLFLIQLCPGHLHPLVRTSLYGYTARANLIIEALEENAAFCVVCKTELAFENLSSFD